MIAAGERTGFTEVELLPEPVAAAFAPVAGGRVEPGSLVLVYDFGGGTFDAAKTVDIWPAARKLSREKTVLADLRAKAVRNEAELAQNLARETADRPDHQDITAGLATAADRAELLIR